MKLESFIAGIILGSAFSNPNNQKLLIDMTRKVAGVTVDNLNKRGNLNAPTIVQPEPEQLD